MKKIGIVAVLSILGLAAMFSTGCGGGSDACDYKIAGTHICVAYDSSYPSASVSAACTAESGTLGSCPSANALGTCKITSGGYTATETYYSDSTPAETADEAKTGCTAGGGTWTAGS